jgi:hypothetical protein
MPALMRGWFADHVPIRAIFAASQQKFFLPGEK